MSLIRMGMIAAALTMAAATMSAQTTDERKVLTEWIAGTTVSKNAVKAVGTDRCFTAEEISGKVLERMRGKSYPDGCTIPLSDLRYLKVLHYNIDGQILVGEMVCNKAIAKDLLEIFRKLYEHHYPIERMVLIDNYDADDERSMRDNNSSCFCYRKIAGSKKLSKHALGLAVDLNTLYNPFCKVRKDGSRFIQPATAKEYCDRQKEFPYKIKKGDLCYNLFIKHGFKWGGNWTSHKDWQHFEKGD